MLYLLHLSLFLIPYFHKVHLDYGVWNETEVLTAVRCVVWSVDCDMMLMVAGVM